MGGTIEQTEYTQPTSEKLREELLALEAEYLRVHVPALESVGDTKFFRPDAQTETKLAQMLQKGADILTQLKPLLDAEGLAELSRLIRDKWPIKKFQEEVERRRDSLARKRPSAPETSQQKP